MKEENKLINIKIYKNHFYIKLEKNKNIIGKFLRYNINLTFF